MNVGFSEDTVVAKGDGADADDVEKKEAIPPSLLERLEAVSTVWQDAAFLETITDRLGFSGAKEAQRRLAGGKDTWKKETGGVVEMARLLDIDTVRSILLLSDEEFRKLRIKDRESVLPACEQRIAWEEMRLQRIAVAFTAADLIEEYWGTKWKSVRDKLVGRIMGSKRVDRADAVVYFLTPELVSRIISVAEETALPIEKLLIDEYESDYEVAWSIEDVYLPSQKLLKTAARESHKSSSFTEEISEKVGRPVVYICNARGGTLFGYTVDTIDTQLARQIQNPALISEFWRQVRNKMDMRINEEDRQNEAVLRVADEWMKAKKLQSLIITVLNTKIPSSEYRGKADERLLSPIAKTAMRLGVPVVFADTSPKQRSRSSERFEAIVSDFAPEYQFKHVQGAGKSGLDDFDLSKPFALSINPSVDSHGWWDDKPHYLGERVRRFSGDSTRLDVLILEEGGYFVFLSEKIENTIKLLDVDSKGSSWFERNFIGFLFTGNEIPQKGSRRYQEMYRDWVPFKTDEKGKAIFDSKGLVIIKESATQVDAGQHNYLKGRAAVRSIIKGA